MTARSAVSEPATSDTDVLLAATHITKSFGGIHALKGASISLRRGEITALIGDNGAGKSTLVRCLSGVHAPDSGTIELDGQVVHFDTPREAQRNGIETVQQNLALVEELTVWQNFFLGRELTSGVGPLRILNRKQMKSTAQALITDLAVNVPPVTSKVRRLSGGQRQALAIARAAGWGGKIVIMDEPTAALGVQETEKVEQTIRTLRDAGVSVLLISHNFDQVMRLSDQVWVMRAGVAVANRRREETSGEELVALITGAQDG
ncbi:MAG: ABC transporter ATP-binding protein [Leifsonia sp.]|nr:ABC transporter ATP-binding protein [Leifsonia sp.]